MNQHAKYLGEGHLVQKLLYGYTVAQTYTSDDCSTSTTKVVGKKYDVA